jgi:hypothetical protein
MAMHLARSKEKESMTLDKWLIKQKKDGNPGALVQVADAMIQSLSEPLLHLQQGFSIAKWSEEFFLKRPAIKNFNAQCKGVRNDARSAYTVVNGTIKRQGRLFYSRQIEFCNIYRKNFRKNKC